MAETYIARISLPRPNSTPMPFLIGFSTASSEAALPLALEKNTKDGGDVHREDQLAEAEQHTDALAADGDGDGGGHAERGEIQDVPGEAEHHLGQRAAKFDDGVGLRADGGARRAEQKSEDYNLKPAIARQR